MAQSSSVLLVALSALTLMACGDDPAEPEDIDIQDIVGTWVLEDSQNSFYLEISADSVRSFSSENDACFFGTVFSIEAVNGRDVTLSNGAIEFEARFRRDGAALFVDGQEFAMSDDDLGALDMCDIPADAVCTDLPELTAPDTVDGALTDADLEDIGGFFYDLYSVRPAVSTSMTIELRSTSFDSYLILFDAEGHPIDADDNSGAAGEDARLITTLPPGCFMVMATTTGVAETGAYIFTVN